jgi:hypothetical protein
MAYKLHKKWRKLVIPPKGYKKCGEKDSAMERLELIREIFKPQIQKMNIFFYYLHFLFLVRYAVSCAITQRTFVSTYIRKLLTNLEWFPIEPFLLYITYGLELFTTIGLFVFILYSYLPADPKEINKKVSGNKGKEKGDDT